MYTESNHEPALCPGDKEGEYVLGCTRSVANKLGKRILPLYSALVRPHLSQFWAPQSKRDADILENSYWRIDDEGTGASLLQGKAERPKTV